MGLGESLGDLFFRDLDDLKQTLHLGNLFGCRKRERDNLRLDEVLSVPLAELGVLQGERLPLWKSRQAALADDSNPAIAPLLDPDRKV